MNIYTYTYTFLMTAMLRPGGLDIADNGEGPDTWSRGAQYRARKAMCRATGKYGKLVETVHLHMATGADALIAIQNPLEMLNTIAARSTCFADLLATTFDATPCTRDDPWSIVLYLSAWLGCPPTRQ